MEYVGRLSGRRSDVCIHTGSLSSPHFHFRSIGSNNRQESFFGLCRVFRGVFRRKGNNFSENVYFCSRFVSTQHDRCNRAAYEAGASRNILTEAVAGKDMRRRCTARVRLLYRRPSLYKGDRLCTKEALAVHEETVCAQRRPSLYTGDRLCTNVCGGRIVPMRGGEKTPPRHAERSSTGVFNGTCRSSSDSQLNLKRYELFVTGGRPQPDRCGGSPCGTAATAARRPDRDAYRSQRLE